MWQHTYLVPLVVAGGHATDLVPQVVAGGRATDLVPLVVAGGRATDLVPLVVAGEVAEDAGGAGDHVDVRRSQQLHQRVDHALQTVL